MPTVISTAKILDNYQYFDENYDYDAEIDKHRTRRRRETYENSAKENSLVYNVCLRWVLKSCQPGWRSDGSAHFTHIQFTLHVFRSLHCKQIQFTLPIFSSVHFTHIQFSSLYTHSIQFPLHKFTSLHWKHIQFSSLYTDSVQFTLHTISSLYTDSVHFTLHTFSLVQFTHINFSSL